MFLIYLTHISQIQIFLYQKNTSFINQTLSINQQISIMRIGSTNSQNKTSYQTQNNQLKKLHEERLKRQQQHKNQNSMIEIINPYINTKSLKSSTIYNSKPYPQNIFLNSILSDQRSIKEKANSISLSSLFQDDPRTFCTGISKNIKGVLMTCYGFVMDVLGPIADSGVPFILVNDSSENGPGRIQRNFAGYQNMSLIIPPRANKGYGVFHTKIWLIRFQTFIRVVISTGNQHAEDWLIWLNAYWYQDFSLKGTKISDFQEKSQMNIKENKKSNDQQKKQQKQRKQKKQKKDKYQKQKEKIILLDDSDDEVIVSSNEKKQQNKQIKKQFNLEQDFRQTLNMVLKNMFPAEFDLNKQLGIQIQKYDFSEVKVILIPSIPGRHTQQSGNMKKYGMAKVKSIIKNIGPSIKKGSLCYNTSSLGSVDQNFLRQLYFSFLPNAESFSSSNIKIIYPSYKYITEQTCGQASVLFLKKQSYYKSELKKQVFYNYQPSQKNCVKGAIPHLKTVIVQNMSPQTQQQKNQCIFFMGSHNMTKAAWGTYEKSDSQISFSNSELGLLFLKMNKEKLLNFIPYKYPPRKYNDYEKPFLKE